MSKRAGMAAAAVAITLLAGAVSTPASADEMSERVFDENRVSSSAIALDMIIVRPVLLVSTVLGSALFVVATPFALLGGGIVPTFNTLVTTPAGLTFVRCPGCTPAQHRNRRGDNRLERATVAAEEEAKQP